MYKEMSQGKPYIIANVFKGTVEYLNSEAEALFFNKAGDDSNFV